MKNSHGINNLKYLFFFFFCFLLFLITLINCSNNNGLAVLNQPIHQFFRSHYSETLHHIMTWFTMLADAKVLIPLTLIVSGWLFFQKQFLTMVFWLGTIGVCLGLAYWLRNIIGIPRPPEFGSFPHEFSFPSGHILGATVICLFSSALLQESLAKKYRWIPWAISFLFISSIILSRLILNLHWFTDIIGGFFWGASFATIGFFIFTQFDHNPIPYRSILIPSILSLIIMMSFYSIKLYSFNKTYTLSQSINFYILKS